MRRDGPVLPAGDCSGSVVVAAQSNREQHCEQARLCRSAGWLVLHLGQVAQSIALIGASTISHALSVAAVEVSAAASIRFVAVAAVRAGGQAWLSGLGQQNVGYIDTLPRDDGFSITGSSDGAGQCRAASARSMRATTRY
jgi:hypothetical protein